MPKGKIWTADELLALTPNERHDIVGAGIVTDVQQVPPGLLELARADVRVTSPRPKLPPPSNRERTRPVKVDEPLLQLLEHRGQIDDDEVGR